MKNARLGLRSTDIQAGQPGPRIARQMHETLNGPKGRGLYVRPEGAFTDEDLADLIARGPFALAVLDGDAGHGASLRLSMTDSLEVKSKVVSYNNFSVSATRSSTRF